MEVKVESLGEVLVVHLRGRMNYESLESFQETCMRHLIDKKVVFNLSELSFVGSIGITPFVQTMTQLRNVNGNSMKFCSVGSEFRKIFESSGLAGVEVFESATGAASSFYLVPRTNAEFDS